MVKVTLLRDSGISQSELAARVCYDSLKGSDNSSIRNFRKNKVVREQKNDDNELLDKLAWTHFHYSILEHSVLTFHIQDFSRGVLQELARHRMQSISVRSTRYTMTDLINILMVSVRLGVYGEAFFISKVKNLDLFESEGDELTFQAKTLREHMLIKKEELAYAEILSSEQIGLVYKVNLKNADRILKQMNKAKKKKNAGDNFKDVVTDAWKTEAVVTMNLRSLKNFLHLRDSGAAYIKMRYLAKEIKKATPNKYLRLIDKEARKEESE